VRKHKAEPRKRDLKLKYPPSPPCQCDICSKYCERPGWWTVEQAEKAIDAGLASRMMLEMSPDLSFGVLAPAFPGCEQAFANYRLKGCTFFHSGLCELHGSGLQPLECGFCHHERVGQGKMCHSEIESDWHSPQGTALVVRWTKITDFWIRYFKFRH